jgi:hypothetical protein
MFVAIAKIENKCFDLRVVQARIAKSLIIAKKSEIYICMLYIIYISYASNMEILSRMKPIEKDVNRDFNYRN